MIPNRTDNPHITVPSVGRNRKGHEPMVSVIVPTCNRPTTLAESLHSILAQTFQDYEILVINDGECDVETIVNDCNRDGKITYIKHGTNRGLAAARNTGLRLARGKYIAYLDDDDRYYPDHLETLVRCLEQGGAKVAYTDAYRVCYVAEGGRYIENGRDVPYSYAFDPRLMLIHNYIPVLCVMHAKACLDVTGLFDEGLSSHEDWDLWIRMSRAYPFVHIPKITAEFAWKTDGSTMTSRMQSEYRANVQLIHRRYRRWVEGDEEVLRAQGGFLRNLENAPSGTEVTCSIIIPMVNQASLTRQYLQEVSHTLGTTSCEVIVVDTGPTDTTASSLDGVSGNVRVIRAEQNRGGAHAYNQGAKSARGRYLIFLHQDVIPQTGWLEPLLSELETHEEVGVVGNKLLNPNGRIRHAGIVIARQSCRPYSLYADAPADAPSVNRRRECWAVEGTCMAVKKRVFDQLHGFDERYRSGLADVDFCVRVHELGYRVVYQPRSVMIHLGSHANWHTEWNAEDYERLCRSWKDRIVEDEDLAYWEDGVVLAQETGNGELSWQIRPFASKLERQCWEDVVAIQRQRWITRLNSVRERFADPRRWPQLPTVLCWAAELCWKAGFETEAERFWTQALRVAEHADIRLRLAKIALQRGNLHDAQCQLSTALGHSPHNGDAHVLQGVLAMQQEDYPRARASFGRARTCGIDDRRVGLGDGMAAWGMGQLDQAWQAFSEVTQRYPDDTEAMNWLLRAGTALEKWDELVERLLAFLARNPAHCDFRFARAGVCLRAGRITEAVQEYTLLTMLEPGHEGLEDLAIAIEREQQRVVGHAEPVVG